MLLRDKVWYSGIGCNHQFQPRSQGSLLPVHTEWEREFVCNLPDSGRPLTRPNQGLSTGRRENLGTKLHQFINKKILSLGKTSSTRENKSGCGDFKSFTLTRFRFSPTWGVFRISGNSWRGCAARFSKSWTYFRPESWHFPHPFSDLVSRIHYLLSDQA